jgi:PAS domain S-box-containing protein
MSLADQGALALENARLHAEAETQRREAEALNRARDFLRSITEHSPDAIVTTDVRGSVTYWSPRAEELFGYRAAEVLGRPAADLQRPGVEGGPAALGPLEAEGPVGDHEVEVRARDGRWIECRASLARLRDAEGRVTGTLAILHDVSERKRLEAQLRQAQKMEAVGRLAGGVAHDFNNLLAVIMGHGDLMRSVLEEDDPLLPEVDEIRRAAERAAGLTRQLLAFSRRQFLQPEIVDLNALLESVAGLLRRLLGEDVELELRLDPGAGCVSADRGQVEQVLMNLALNARDAMPGGGRLAVETAAVTLDPAFVREHPGSAPGPHVRLTIRDSGTGMAADVLAHLFEPFFTTKEPGRGTGLGLSTVYGIVKQHRGYVDVESEPGRGSTFRIFLPRVDAAVRPADPAAPAPAPGGRETVLFVEDAEVLRDLLQRVLAQGGYHVLAAADGLDALARVEAHAGPIDLVVTDVIMPGLSGPEFAARLRERRPGIRVLYVSGHAADALGEGPQPDGAFLAKPFTPHALLQKVREVLDAPPP